MPAHGISNNGILTYLNCHIQNIHKTSSGRRWSQRAVLPLVVIAFFCVLECASGSAPLSLSSKSISFGSVTVGSSMTQVVTLTNPGTRSVRILEATVKGAEFSISGLELPLTLGSNQSTTFGVRFAPTATGSVSGSLTIVIYFHYTFLSIALSGTGVVQSPSVAMSANSLAFGSQAVGATSAAQTVTLSNTGNGALSIRGIALTGANFIDFAQSNNCGASVAAGGSCTISVTFTPVASGSFTAAVSVADNASGSPQTVTLSGTGASPGVSLSPSSLAFGGVPIDSVSSLQIISLSNTGNAVLSITSLAIGGANSSDFAETADTCGSSVVAGGHCTIGITFTPSLAGAETASITVTDNAGGSPQTVALSGTGAHDVILTWTASTTSGVAGYNFYRGTTSRGESTTPLNPTPIAGTTFTDSNVLAGQAYYYVVTAVAANGTEQSPGSSEVSATVPSP